MTETVFIIGISAFGACAIIMCLTGMAVFTIRSFRGTRSGGSSEESSTESALIQELHAGLMRMESRIESLETILMDTIERKNAKVPQPPASRGDV